MAANFRLIPRHDPGHGPMHLVAVDKVICDHFHQPCHEKHWFQGWYDHIGFSLAVGRNINELIVRYAGWVEQDKAEAEPDAEWTVWILAIAVYIRDNFIIDSWISYGPKH